MSKQMKIIKIIMLLVFMLSFSGCSQKEVVDGNFIKPYILLNNNYYGLSSSKPNTKELSDDYRFYGLVSSAVDQEVMPSQELQTTRILEDNKGYKVYISNDEQNVCIFNEEINEYVYYDIEIWK